MASNKEQGPVSAIKRFNKGAQRSGETLGLSLAIIVLWALQEFAGVDAPTIVDQAITAVMVVVTARWRDNA